MKYSIDGDTVSTPFPKEQGKYIIKKVMKNIFMMQQIIN